MPLPFIVGALAQLSPVLGGLLFGEKGEQVAGIASKVVQSVTGKGSDEEAVEALKARPELLVEVERQISSETIALYQEDTKRLQTVNETMRSEQQNSDWVVRRARPAFMWSMAVTWTIQSLAIAGAIFYAVFVQPQWAKEILEGIREVIDALASHWMYALAVTGVAVWARSEDKKTAAGSNGGGVFGRVIGAIRGGR